MNGGSSARTRVTRSRAHTLFGGGIGLALGVVTVWFLCVGMVGWAVVIGVLAVILLGGAWRLSGRAPCPACGKEIAQISQQGRVGYEKCPGCGLYVEGDKGEIWPVEPDRIADEPAFSLVLPESFRMPEVCCACGEPASRFEQVKLRLGQVAHPNLSVFAKLVDVGLEVPHCESHQGGGKLDREVPREPLNAESLLVGGRIDPVTVLKVRSHAFYRRFRELNPPAPPKPAAPPV